MPGQNSMRNNHLLDNDPSKKCTFELHHQKNFFYQLFYFVISVFLIKQNNFKE